MDFLTWTGVAKCIKLVDLIVMFAGVLMFGDVYIPSDGGNLALSISCVNACVKQAALPRDKYGFPLGILLGATAM